MHACMHGCMHACDAWAAPGHAQPEGSAKARASCPANAGASKPRPPRLPVISQSPGHQTLIITLPEKHNKTHHQRKDKHAMQRTNPQEATTTITTCARTPENKQKRVPQEIAPPGRTSCGTVASIALLRSKDARGIFPPQGARLVSKALVACHPLCPTMPYKHLAADKSPL